MQWKQNPASISVLLIADTGTPRVIKLAYIDYNLPKSYK